MNGLDRDRRAYLVDFLMQHSGGQTLPAAPDAWATPVQIGEQIVGVTDHGFHVVSRTRSCFPGEAGDPRVQRDLIHRLGSALDAELASGRLDHWFAADASKP